MAIKPITGVCLISNIIRHTTMLGCFLLALQHNEGRLN